MQTIGSCRSSRRGGLRWLMAGLCLVVAAGHAAPLQQALDDYERGRLRQAQAGFERLAREGVPIARYNLAVMHLRAEVPNADRALARRLLTESAESGFVTAQFMLAHALESGQFGRPDLRAAQLWYLRAAQGGSTEAQLAMGTAHYLGRGEEKDPVAAARWFREAARAGDVGAQYLLASMYEQGDGVPRDLRLARYWYEQAARQGDEAAPLKVRELDARLADLATATTRP